MYIPYIDYVYLPHIDYDAKVRGNRKVVPLPYKRYEAFLMNVINENNLLSSQHGELFEC